MENIIVRPVSSDELPTVYQMEKECFSEDGAYTFLALRQLHEISGDLCLLAEKEGPLGYTLGAIASSGEVGWVLNLAVLPDSRGKGLGELLTQNILSNFSERNVKELRLTVEPDNLPAISLYKKVGFKDLSLEKNYFGSGCDRIIMQYLF